MRYKDEYFAEQNRPRPDKIKIHRLNGRYLKPKEELAAESPANHVAPTRDACPARPEDFSNVVSRNTDLLRYLLKHGIPGKLPAPGGGVASGISIPGASCVASPDASRDSFCRNSFMAMLHRLQLGVASDRCVVAIAYPGDNRWLIDLAGKLGVEFMTPDEIVAEFGPKPEGDAACPMS